MISTAMISTATRHTTKEANHRQDTIVCFWGEKRYDRIVWTLRSAQLCPNSTNFDTHFKQTRYDRMLFWRKSIRSYQPLNSPRLGEESLVSQIYTRPHFYRRTEDSGEVDYEATKSGGRMQGAGVVTLLGQEGCN